jgi:hypothetical protein
MSFNVNFSILSDNESKIFESSIYFNNYKFEENNWEYYFENNNNTSINFKVIQRNEYPNFKYEDSYTLKNLHESFRLLTLYDNISDIIGFFKERIENKEMIKYIEGNYFKLIFKSPMKDVSDVIIKIKPEKFDIRERLLESTKEILKLKKSFLQIDEKIELINQLIENNNKDIENLKNENEKNE